MRASIVRRAMPSPASGRDFRLKILHEEKAGDHQEVSTRGTIRKQHRFFTLPVRDISAYLLFSNDSTSRTPSTHTSISARMRKFLLLECLAVDGYLEDLPDLQDLDAHLGDPYADLGDPSSFASTSPEQSINFQHENRQVVGGLFEDLLDLDDLDAYLGDPSSFAFTGAEQSIDFHTSFEGMPPNGPADQGLGPTALPEIGQTINSNDLDFRFSRRSYKRCSSSRLWARHWPHRHVDISRCQAQQHQSTSIASGCHAPGKNTANMKEIMDNYVLAADGEDISRTRPSHWHYYDDCPPRSTSPPGDYYRSRGAPNTSREVLKIGYLHGLLLLLCDLLAQKEILPQSTERIVEVQGTPEGIKGAIWEICKCLDDEDLQGRTRAQTGSRKDHRRCKFKYYQRRQSRSKYRNVYRCKGYPGNHDCKNMLYTPVVCTQSDATNMASISHFFKQETR
ncbi:KH domain-containing protein [Colletotrichum simmondsii]|uniref:KH domain-containing protein n=1 Tax=Colletotrichum simmondsii TaxID=703756 RepID=A0A135RZ90_9PEZI|nr:KH domain-containing protein [Colletotrichum simmondsii]